MMSAIFENNYEINKMQNGLSSNNSNVQCTSNHPEQQHFSFIEITENTFFSFAEFLDEFLLSFIRS